MPPINNQKPDKCSSSHGRHCCILKNGLGFECDWVPGLLSGFCGFCCLTVCVQSMQRCVFDMPLTVQGNGSEARGGVKVKAAVSGQVIVLLRQMGI